MLKIINIVFVLFFLSSSAYANTCSIKFGGGGKDSSWINLKNNNITKVNNIGGPWSFIRATKGACRFIVYNKKNYSGKHIQYGSKISKRVRIGAKGAQNKGGWKVRSLQIIPSSTRCAIVLGDNGVSQTFYGPSNIRNISGWSFVRSTRGRGCSYTLYNGFSFNGRLNKLEKVNGKLQINWRVRSIKISK